MPGSIDDVTAAYDRGEITREQYRTLAHAVADAINAVQARVAPMRLPGPESSRALCDGAGASQTPTASGRSGGDRCLPAAATLRRSGLDHLEPREMPTTTSCCAADASSTPRRAGTTSPTSPSLAAASPRSAHALGAGRGRPQTSPARSSLPGSSTCIVTPPTSPDCGCGHSTASRRRSNSKPASARSRRPTGRRPRKAGRSTTASPRRGRSPRMEAVARRRTRRQARHLPGQHRHPGLARSRVAGPGKRDPEPAVGRSRRRGDRHRAAGRLRAGLQIRMSTSRSRR